MPTIGVDTGGTFTDLVYVDGDDLRVEKLPSTPGDPANAIQAGLLRFGPLSSATRVVHGTTVALNALLSGKIARCALVTNRGFRDLLEIARQDRPEIYALEPRKPAPVIPRELRFEIGQRSWPAPDSRKLVEIEHPSRAELARLARSIRRSGAESIAICLLHAWADPRIETRVAGALRATGLPITCSAQLLREYREYERFSTCAVNACLVPLMQAYLGGLERRLRPAQLALLQSTGGLLSAKRAAREPARVLLSGPAGGVVGAAEAARDLGLAQIATLDMGGTSTDVGFHSTSSSAREHGARSGVSTAEPAMIAGQPVALPALDIHTIGCGGGSIVRLDASGALRVGPHSAGADPGPACHGRSRVPTVTDAHVLLGHIGNGRFLNGQLELDLGAARRAFEPLASSLSVRPERAARAVLLAARAAMRRAISVMTLERGRDPRGLALVAFGGAGGLHACELAESLRMRCAVVPRFPGALSALGLASSRASAEASRSILEPLRLWPAALRASVLTDLVRAAWAELQGEFAHGQALVRECELELRYRGQAFELRILEGSRALERFHQAHELRYGYRLEGREVELVGLRARLTARHPRPARVRVHWRRMAAGAVIGSRRVASQGRWERCPVIARELLRVGERFEGPALVEEYSGTTWLPRGWRAGVHAGGHLVLERGDF